MVEMLQIGISTAELEEAHQILLVAMLSLRVLTSTQTAVSSPPPHSACGDFLQVMIARLYRFTLPLPRFGQRYRSCTIFQNCLQSHNDSRMTNVGASEPTEGMDGVANIVKMVNLRDCELVSDTLQMAGFRAEKTGRHN